MFYAEITREEVDDAVRFLVENHGPEARREAERLAEVGRRLGSRRNSALFRRAAQALQKPAPAQALQKPPLERRSWRDALRDYARPRVPET